MSPELEHLANRVLSALGNGVYQGLLLAALVWAGLKLFPRSSAATRHAVNLVTLIAVVLLPVVHLFTASRGGVVPVAASNGITAEPPAMALADGPEAIEVAMTAEAGLISGTEPGHSFPREPESIGEMPPAAETGPKPWRDDEVMAAAAVSDSEPVVETFGPRGISSHTVLSEAAPSVPSAVAVPRTSWTVLDDLRAWVGRHWRPVLPAGASVVVLVVLGALALVRLGFLLWQCRLLLRLKRRGIRPDHDLERSFRGLCREMAVDRPVTLLLSGSVKTPIAVGFGRPAVMLPENFAGATASAHLDQVLRHELAHVIRRDDWANLLQQAVAAGMFFHPSVWWLSRRLTIDREIACDDHVLAAIPAPRDYALLLTEFASQTHGPDWAPASAAWSKTSHLKERITMILNTERNTSLRPAMLRVGAFATVTALVAALGVYAGPRVEVASTDNRRADAAADANLNGNVDTAVSVTALTPPPAEAPVTDPLSSDTIKLKVDSAVSVGGVALAGLPPVQPVPTPAPHPRVAVNARRPVIVAANGETLAAPAPAAPPAAAGWPREPRPPGAAVWVDRAPDDPMERRLERLERLVESLAKREDRKPDFKFEDKELFHSDSKRHFEEQARLFEKQSKDAAKQLDQAARAHERLMREQERASRVERDWQLHSDLKIEGMPGVDEKELSRLLDQVSRQVEVATRDAQRAVEQAMLKAQREALRVQESRPRDGAVKQRREALHAQREALQSQLERIQNQMERLDEHLDQIDGRLEEVEDIEEENRREKPAEGADKKPADPAAESGPKAKLF